MSLRSYTTKEVSSITRFSARQLDYWDKEGIIVPSIQPSHGPGTRRLYGLDNLLVLRFIRQLKQHKWSMPKIRKALTKLRAVMDDPDALHRSVLIHGKGTILAICKTKAGERILLDTLDSGGQQVMFIVLETLEEETRHVASQVDGDDRRPPEERFSHERGKDGISSAEESLEEVSFDTT